MWDPGRNSPHFQCSRKPTLCVKPPAREKDKPALVNRAGKLFGEPRVQPWKETHRAGNTGHPNQPDCEESDLGLGLPPQPPVRASLLPDGLTQEARSESSKPGACTKSQFYPVGCIPRPPLTTYACETSGGWE